MVFYSSGGVRRLVFRSFIGILIFGIVGLTIVFCVGLFLTNRPTAQVDVRYYQNVIGSKKVVALTFDDGPFPGRTERIIQILKRENVPATFFFIGSRAVRFPKTVALAHSQGFEIGNHTFTHAQAVHSAPWRLRLELNLTSTIIETITNEAVRLYRPPFLLDIGSDPTIEVGSRPQLSWAADDGYVVVGADVDPKDWLATSSEAVANNLVRKLEETGGHIVLLHDGSSEHYTVEALETMVRVLRERGYSFATVSELLGLDAASQMAITRDLVLGDQNTPTDASVSALQTFLIMQGFPNEDATGIFNLGTQDALAKWQTKHGLESESGEVRLRTRQAIDVAVRETMYQPLPDFDHTQLLFSHHLAKVYVATAPWFAGYIFVTVQVVLVLAILRLLLTMLLRIVAAVRKPKRPQPWQNGVSVIIPAYNEEENIAATVMTVLHSTHVLLDVIVVDDGSKDRTAELVAEIQRKYPARIRLYSVANSGKAHALNLGMRLARYDTVVTMDGDTIFDRHTIARLVRHFHDPRVGAVAGKVSVSKSRNILNAFQSTEYIMSQNIDKTGLNVVNAIGVVPGPVGAWRKSLVQKIGGYSHDTLVEDQDLTLAMLAHGWRVVYEPMALAYSETPYYLKDFVKQRSRWVFGTIQCLWKYKRFIFSLRHPALGFVVLPNTLIFSVVLPLLIPLMDGLLLLSLLGGFAKQVLVPYLLFTLVDMAYASIAVILERKKYWQVLILPLQRVFYRVVIFLVVFKSIIKAIEGTQAHWNKVRKRGDTHKLHLQILNQAAGVQTGVMEKGQVI